MSTVRFLVRRNPAYPLAKIPTRGSSQAAGYDLYAAEDTVIPKSGRAVVQTGISVAIPEGHYGRVAPRSGLGVVDADYRGLLGVVLFNFGDEDFQFHAGDRIAQLVLEKISTPDIEEVEVRGVHSLSRWKTPNAAAAALAPPAASGHRSESIDLR
ncbi:hypothetical protein CBS9595_002776 [Malassezia furfur]|nr:hypothetical protein CBS9595_002776 [Malassezia furfur]